MKPYYEQDGVTIYHGDCREILSRWDSPDLVLTDPPYGTDAAVDNARLSGGSVTGPRTSVKERIPIHGDKEPFDPSHLLRFKRLVLWGANNYAARLPDSNGWLVWDKRVGLEDMEGWPLGEGELAWTNVTGGVRFFRNRWMGLVRGDERGEFYHPTQKPTVLMEWIIRGRSVRCPRLRAVPLLRRRRGLGLCPRRPPARNVEPVRRCKCGAEVAMRGATYCRPCAARVKREWLAREDPVHRERRLARQRAYHRSYYIERKIARFNERYAHAG